MAASRFQSSAPDPSPAHERRESPAMERQEHKTGRELQDERKPAKKLTRPMFGRRK